MKLRYTPAAICDIEEISDYITNVLMNPTAAQNIVGKIARDCNRLKDQPRMGIELSRKTGREIEGYCLISGQYMVIYDLDDAVSILRVLDTRLDYVRILLSMSDKSH